MPEIGVLEFRVRTELDHAYRLYLNYGEARDQRWLIHDGPTIDSPVIVDFPGGGRSEELVVDWAPDLPGEHRLLVGTCGDPERVSATLVDVGLDRPVAVAF